MTVDSLVEDARPSSGYHHVSYEGRRRFLRWLIKHIGFPLLVKYSHAEGIENIPQQGAAILMINHIAFVDPLVVLHAVPRNIVPLAKIEVYRYPLVGIFPKMWGVIPVRRQEFDRRAVQQMMNVLQAGEIVLVAPEGTRGPYLRRGKEGVAYLASRSQAAVIPVYVEGTEGFPALRYTPSWRGKGAVVRFGRPFRYKPEYRHAGRAELRKMTDEALYVLAAMLPPHRRGEYYDLSQMTYETIEWMEPAKHLD